MMNEQWQCIYTTTHLHEIEIVRSVLNDHEIKSVVVDKRDSNYITLGEIELYVSNEDVILAKIIIQQDEL